MTILIRFALFLFYLLIVLLFIDFLLSFISIYYENKKTKKLRESDSPQDRIEYYRRLYSYMPPTFSISTKRISKNQ